MPNRVAGEAEMQRAQDEMVARRPRASKPVGGDGSRPNGSYAPGEATEMSKAHPIIKTAAALRTQTFAPLKYIVPDLIVEGCVLLAGRPKAGKSWLALDVGIAVAAGRYCLGDRKPEQGSILYLALEDGDRRMQRRIGKLLPTFGREWPDKFHYATEWPRADQGGVEKIELWCNEHTDARLVVIDILAKFRAPSRGKISAYEQDYAALSKLQELATRQAITVLVVHHTRKGEAEDPVEEISGTLGLAGAADAFLVLKRTAAAATLIGRGRDTEEIDLAIQFSPETCRWTILGEAAEVRRSDERGRVLAALADAAEPMPTNEIMAAAGLHGRNAADLLLSKMCRAGEIERVKRGVYRLPTNIRQSGQKDRTDCQPINAAGKNGHPSDLSNLSRPHDADTGDIIERHHPHGVELHRNDPGADLDIPVFLRRTPAEE
jgi:hypothetical protein